MGEAHLGRGEDPQLPAALGACIEVLRAEAGDREEALVSLPGMGLKVRHEMWLLIREPLRDVLADLFEGAEDGIHPSTGKACQLRDTLPLLEAVLVCAGVRPGPGLAAPAQARPAAAPAAGAAPVGAEAPAGASQQGALGPRRAALEAEWRDRSTPREGPGEARAPRNPED